MGFCEPSVSFVCCRLRSHRHLVGFWYAIFIDSPGGGHLVRILCSGEVFTSLSFFGECGLGILVPFWWWLMWAFGGLLPVQACGGHPVIFFFKVLVV